MSNQKLPYKVRPKSNEVELWSKKITRPLFQAHSTKENPLQKGRVCFAFCKKIKGRIVSPFILKSISSQIDVCAKSLANTGKLTLFCERVKRRTHAELSRNIVVVVVSARRSHTIRIVVIVIIAGAPPSKQKPGDFHPV